MRSSRTYATVLSSALTTRCSETELTARATGSSARTPATSASRLRSGPGGSAGQRTRACSGRASSLPSALVSVISVAPPAVACCRISPARYSRQSKVSSQVRRTACARPGGAHRRPGPGAAGRPLDPGPSSSSSTSSRGALRTVTQAYDQCGGPRSPAAKQSPRARQAAALPLSARPQPPQPQAPPQQPPSPEAAPAARPPTATVESSFTVSSCPCGQLHGADDSLIGLTTSNVAPQARQRYSYLGTAPAYGRPPTAGALCAACRGSSS